MDQLIALINGACLRMQSSALHWVSHSNRSKSEPKKPEKFKTQLCHHYSQHGFCRFGSSCWFAHGENELRSVSGASSFSSPIGSRKPRSLVPRPSPSLMFGSSCWFAHGEKELRSVSGDSLFPSPIGSRKPRSLMPRPPPSLLFNIFPKNP
ncbi:hypothetical protein niasHS_010339 [Heterodera schachtii]|uniref:C3H1-type domain-containing protein n=1 Tax=Heterodera schachtii TaxID=97005 RepID=A0ABD2J4K0_HETSC